MEKLPGFIEKWFLGRKILPIHFRVLNTRKRQAKEAKIKAEQEFEVYRKIQDKGNGLANNLPDRYGKTFIAIILFRSFFSYIFTASFSRFTFFAPCSVFTFRKRGTLSFFPLAHVL
jgi:hypothetical protein